MVVTNSFKISTYWCHLKAISYQPYWKGVCLDWVPYVLSIGFRVADSAKVVPGSCPCFIKPSPPCNFAYLTLACWTSGISAGLACQKQESPLAEKTCLMSNSQAGVEQRKQENSLDDFSHMVLSSYQVPLAAPCPPIHYRQLENRGRRLLKRSESKSFACTCEVQCVVDSGLGVVKGNTEKWYWRQGCGKACTLDLLCKI